MKKNLQKRLEANDWSSIMLHFKEGNPLHIANNQNSVSLDEDTVIVTISNVPLQNETGESSQVTATITETFLISEIRRITYIKENIVQTIPGMVSIRGNA